MSESLARKMQQILQSTVEEDTSLDEYIKRIEEHREQCERSGNYKEAELVKVILERLHKENELRQMQVLDKKQAAERLGVDEAHLNEFQQFNDMWLAKREVYEQHAADLERVMIERHGNEMLVFQDGAENELRNLRPKWSKDLLNLRKIENTLAKQKEYVQAQKIKSQADNLEKFEMERARAVLIEKFQRKELVLLTKHRTEMSALQKRIESGRAEFEKQRHSDFQRLVQRYQNVKKGLEAQQNIERAKVEIMLNKLSMNKNKKTTAAAASVNASRSTSTAPYLPSGAPAGEDSALDNQFDFERGAPPSYLPDPDFSSSSSAFNNLPRDEFGYKSTKRAAPRSAPPTRHQPTATADSQPSSGAPPFTAPTTVHSRAKTHSAPARRGKPVPAPVEVPFDYEPSYGFEMIAEAPPVSSSFSSTSGGASSSMRRSRSNPGTRASHHGLPAVQGLETDFKSFAGSSRKV